MMVNYNTIGHVGIKVGAVEVKLVADDRIAQSVAGGKPFEPATLERFSHAVVPGQWVVDVGCYSGLFSIAAVKMGAKAVGFEPMVENQQAIHRNKLLNNVEFALSTYALSDKDADDVRFGFNAGVHLTSGGSLERKSGSGRQIPVRRMDSVLSYDTYDKICVIKMDVERHEPAVIRGAVSVIQKHRPILIIEANDEGMRDKVCAEVLKLNCGYVLEGAFDVRNLVFACN